MKVGVISVQGAFPEHIAMAEQAMRHLGRTGTAISVKRVSDLDGAGAVIIPGGESTTISRLMVRFGIFDRILELAHEGVPIMGTCAGLVLLAKEGDEGVSRTETRLLGLMDMAVDRNAFGRQRESFETELRIKGMDKAFPAVFIRAPIIRRLWGGAEEIARYKDGIVMVRQENLLALSFHPELSKDTRVHEMLIGMA
jgi:5'-phosphate synthase pdxT subunit